MSALKTGPGYCDTEARLKAPRPIYEPGPGRALHGQQARLAGIWLRRYADRKYRAPLSPKAHRRILSWIQGRRPVYIAEWNLILDYVQRKKAEAKQRTSVTLRLGGVGLGGLLVRR